MLLSASGDIYGNTQLGFANGLKPSGVPDGGPVVAGTFPTWETQTPRTPVPSPYILAQEGYRANPLIFSCIQYRAAAMAEPPLRVYDTSGKTRKEVDNHPLSKLLRRPNPTMGTAEFIKAMQIYRDIAGVTAWEGEFSKAGDLLALWPLRPDYSQYLRGPNTPLRAIRYIYPGLPIVDIPIERLFVAMEFDPIYPGVQGLSRCAVAGSMVGIDNSATAFLNFFFKNGSAIPGLLKTAQQLSEAEANRAKARWMQQHGGPENWSQVAVLGNGLEYQQVGMPLKDLDMTNIDGRTESRICMAMRVSPILLGAKIGLTSSTYSNYSEARQFQYESVFLPDWQWLAGELTQQLLPWFGEDPNDSNLVVDFDLSDIKALQPDRTAIYQRVDTAYNSGLMTLNEAREEMALEPVDEGDLFKGEKTIEDTPPQLLPFTGQSGSTATMPPEFEEPTVTDAPKADEPQAEDETQTLKAWRNIALNNIGQPVGPFGAELVGCKTKSDVRAVFERHWPRSSELTRLALAIEQAASKL